MRLVEIWEEYRSLMLCAEQLSITKRVLDGVMEHAGNMDERIDCLWVASDMVEGELETVLERISVLLRETGEKQAKELAQRRMFDEMAKGGLK